MPPFMIFLAAGTGLQPYFQASGDFHWLELFWLLLVLSGPAYIGPGTLSILSLQCCRETVASLHLQVCLLLSILHSVCRKWRSKWGICCPCMLFHKWRTLPCVWWTVALTSVFFSRPAAVWLRIKSCFRLSAFWLFSFFPLLVKFYNLCTVAGHYQVRTRHYPFYWLQNIEGKGSLDLSVSEEDQHRYLFCFDILCQSISSIVDTEHLSQQLLGWKFRLHPVLSASLHSPLLSFYHYFPHLVITSARATTYLLKKQYIYSCHSNLE